MNAVDTSSMTQLIMDFLPVILIMMLFKAIMGMFDDMANSLS